MKVFLYVCTGPFVEPREAWIVAKTKHFVAHYDRCTLLAEHSMNTGTEPRPGFRELILRDEWALSLVLSRAVCIEWMSSNTYIVLRVLE